MPEALSSTTLALVEQWVKETDGKPFSLNSLRELHGITSASDRAKLGTALHRLVVQKGRVESLGRGIYRLIPREEPEIELTKVNPYDFFPCKIPLGNVSIDDYVVLYHKSLCVVAGVSNQGKTAFLLNLIKANMAQQDIWYFFSEGGGEQLVDRLLLFDMPIEDWHFHAIPRTFNFVEVIRPDAFNIIDFYTEPDDYRNIDIIWLKIIEKLGKGICWVAIQKKQSTKMNPVALGVGGQFTEHRTQLYLVMENNTLRIQKAKKWKKLTINPNGMRWKYKLVGGAEFVNVEQSYSQGGLE